MCCSVGFCVPLILQTAISIPVLPRAALCPLLSDCDHRGHAARGGHGDQRAARRLHAQVGAFPDSVCFGFVLDTDASWLRVWCLRLVDCTRRAHCAPWLCILWRLLGTRVAADIGGPRYRAILSDFC